MWTKGQKLLIPYEELQVVMNDPGSSKIVTDFLLVDAPYATVCELFGRDDIAPEYRYTPMEIKRLLSSGSLDELLDCLDFAPAGVIDLVKTFAVSMKLPDANKREAIKDATGFDLDRALNNLKLAEIEADSIKEEKKERRVQAPVTEADKKDEVTADNILDI